MEYLASGTPVLTTRLPGMPEEYYEHVLTIDGSTADDVTAALERAAALGTDRAARARGPRASLRAGPQDHESQGLRIMQFALGESND